MDAKRDLDERVEGNRKLAEWVSSQIESKLKPSTNIQVRKDEVLIFKGIKCIKILFRSLRFREDFEHEIRKMGF